MAELSKIINDKNEIINHLAIRLQNQEKQIQMLVQDAEDKHHHEITKYYTKSYEKYLKNGKYLLLRVDEVIGNGIYLPKNIKIVHFGQLEVDNGYQNPSHFGSANRMEETNRVDFGPAETEPG